MREQRQVPVDPRTQARNAGLTYMEEVHKDEPEIKKARAAITKIEDLQAAAKATLNSLAQEKAIAYLALDAAITPFLTEDLQKR